MSDQNFAPSEETDWKDALVDSLLEESAAIRSNDDEVFLACVEAAIDADEVSPIKNAPKSQILMAVVVAAAVMLAFVSILFFKPDTSSPSKDEGSPTVAAAKVTPPIEPLPTETIQLQKLVKKADETALRGSQLMAEGDYQGTIDHYRNALSLLPEAPITEPRRRAYSKQFSRASMLLARQRADEGRYPESLALVEEVLQPSVDPTNIEAKRLIERLNDPDYYSPGLTPTHLKRVRKLKIASSTSQAYLKLGDLDRADREYRQALSTDAYSVASRQKAEPTERYRLSYYDTAYDHTRARMLRQISKGWESPVATPITNEEMDWFAPPRSSAGIQNNSWGANSAVRYPGESSLSSQYGLLADNEWASPTKVPLSTFSIDVDTASWTNIRGMIRSGLTASQIPNDAVRIEELVNYFDWSYPQPEGEHPFSASVETASCPWNEDHLLMSIGIQGKSIEQRKRAPANLVFLIDVSGSMDHPMKLPLVKRAITNLVAELNTGDRVSIVVYAGSEGVALNPTIGSNHDALLYALDNLEADGSTNGGAGIQLAYRLARDQFIENGINRVILCTDGDFNVGTTGNEDLIKLVKEEAEDDIFLSVCGFGQDNLNDSMLEAITNQGNGNYFFIDSQQEGRRVFLKDLMGTLVTIAKDVKIQVEFNPSQVEAYRLIGYANRRLNAEDFENDEIDAGEVGSGHSVTALYEIVPVGTTSNLVTENLRYQKTTEVEPASEIVPSSELALLKLRYKKPNEDASIFMEQPIMPADGDWKEASDDFRFASAVSLFGLILREHPSAAKSSLEEVAAIADTAHRDLGDRQEFVDLVKQLIDSE